jgi:hypothetical protein
MIANMIKDWIRPLKQMTPQSIFPDHLLLYDSDFWKSASIFHGHCNLGGLKQL